MVNIIIPVDLFCLRKDLANAEKIFGRIMQRLKLRGGLGTF